MPFLSDIFIRAIPNIKLNVSCIVKVDHITDVPKIFGKTRMTAVVKTKLRSTFKMTAGIVRFVEYRYVEIKVFNAIIINPKAYIGIT